MLKQLLKLANDLDEIGQYKIAGEIDMLTKCSEQLQNTYYPIGDKGPQLGGEADQESEVAEELNEEMEAREQEGYTPGNDNLVIDKNNNPTDGFGVFGKLSRRDILVCGQ